MLMDSGSPYLCISQVAKPAFDNMLKSVWGEKTINLLLICVASLKLVLEPVLVRLTRLLFHGLGP